MHGPSEMKRELVEALVEGIRIDTVYEEGCKTARATIRYPVSGPRGGNSDNELGSLGPRKPMTYPVHTSKSTPSTAVKDSNRRVRPSTRMTPGGAPVCPLRDVSCGARPGAAAACGRVGSGV